MNYNNNRQISSVLARFGPPELFLVTIGLAALTVGILIYVVDRSSTAVYFVPDSWRIAETTPLFFGALGNYLPAFFHALAFALFINAIAGRRYIGFMCVSWFIAEVFLEMAQIDPIAFRISGVLPGWFAELPILQNISSHFLTGRFDQVDVVFLMLGCAAAYGIGWTALPQHKDGLKTQAVVRSRKVRLAGLLLVASVGLTSIISSGGTGDAPQTIIKGPSSHVPQKLPGQAPAVRS